MDTRNVLIGVTAIVAIGGFLWMNSLRPEAIQSPTVPAPKSPAAVALPSPPAPTPKPKEPSVEELLLTVESNLKSSYSDAQRVCTTEWTKRGELDQRMYNHCIEQQNESISGLAHIIDTQKGHRRYPLSLAYCYQEWRKQGISNPRMTEHCMEQEIEAWKDIDYYRGIYNSDTVDNLVHKGMMRYGSWRMGVYHMKRQLGIE